MSITRCLTVQLASLALSLAFTAGPVFAQSAHVLVPADKVQWGPAPPALPADIKAALADVPSAEIFSYPNYHHAFARHNGLHYDARAAALANRRTETFLNQNCSGVRSKSLDDSLESFASGKRKIVSISRVGGAGSPRQSSQTTVRTIRT